MFLFFTENNLKKKQQQQENTNFSSDYLAYRVLKIRYDGTHIGEANNIVLFSLYLCLYLFTDSIMFDLYVKNGWVIKTQSAVSGNATYKKSILKKKKKKKNKR